MCKFKKQNDRAGNIIILASLMMVFAVGAMAFALDIGYVLVARTELQRTADAAALSASWDLINERSLGNDPYMSTAIANARLHAVQYSASNLVVNEGPIVDGNAENHTDGDVVVGYLADFSNPYGALQLSDPSLFNAVSVRVQRSSTQNGSVPLSFARIFGWNAADMEAVAMAALQTNFVGFQTPGDGSNLGFLPFALDEDTWLDLVAGKTNDDWTWDAETETARPYGDGIHEVNLFPEGTDAPGNRGTVDVGSGGNSTDDIARQITDGVSAEDLEHHGGELKLDDNGELVLNGDTGISAGVSDELASIIGKPRIIPIFRTVTENGNNAMYTIVKFVGIRILEVDLTGSGAESSSGQGKGKGNSGQGNNGQSSSKRVIIQPAPMVTLGGIPGSGPTTTELIYAPPRLVR